MKNVLAVASVALLAITSPIQAQEPKLGEKGFMHTEEMHSLYQTFFGQGKCHCSAGQCRPSRWERVEKSEKIPTGIMVYVDGKMCPVREEVLLKSYQIPPEIMKKLRQMPWNAHICAYASPGPTTCPIIECVLALSDS